MNNREFLDGLMKRADGSLQAWFDEEHAEPMAQSTNEPSLSEVSSENAGVFTDSDEKLMADIEEYIDGWAKRGTSMSVYGSCMIAAVNGWLERKAELTRKRESKAWRQAASGPIYEQRTRAEKAEAKVDELKAKVDMLIERQCPHYRPSEHYCDVHDYDFSENAVSRELARDLQKQNAELVQKVDSQAAEIDALKAELKMARGEVKTVLNNTAQAERRIKAKEAELDRRLNMPADAELKDRLEGMKRSKDYYENEYNRLCGVLLHIQGVARERKVPDTPMDDDGR